METITSTIQANAEINAAARINAARSELKLPTIDIDRIGKAVISEEDTAKAADEAKAVQKANKTTLTAAYSVISKDEHGNFRELGLVLEIMYVPRTKARLAKIRELMKDGKSYETAYIATRQDETAVAGNETKGYMLVAKARTNAIKKEADAKKEQADKETALTEKQQLVAAQEELQKQQDALLQRSEQLEAEKKQAVDAVQREINDLRISSDTRIADLLQQLAQRDKALTEAKAEVADLQAANAALKQELHDVKHELAEANAASKSGKRVKQAA